MSTEKQSKKAYKNKPDDSNENTSEKIYIAIWDILAGGKKIEANCEVSAEELGEDFERLLEMGAIGELLEDDSNAIKRALEEA